MTDIIRLLLQIPFSRRSYDEKKTIIEEGRPCPSLPELKIECKDKSKTYFRTFSVSQYKSHPWLAGSSTLNALFCWPCLLFSTSTSSWNGAGFTNLKNLSNSQNKHITSTMHLKSVLTLSEFGKSENRVDEGLNNHLKMANSEHNKKVTKNREVLKRLIDVTCFLANQELAFRGHDESDSSLNKGNYIETLNLLKNYDSLLNEHLETATVFKGTSSAIQNDLIGAISNVAEARILKETSETPFVAIMLDETSDVQMTSQLSTVIRYFYDGEIKERFLGFTDVSANRTADGLFAHVESVIQKFNLKDKLVAQTYDGAAVMSGHLNGLQQKVISKYPSALHVHCYAHVLNLVLSQSFNHISGCNVFFQTLNGIATFASHSTKRTFTLKEFLKRKIPSLATTRWSFTSRLVNVVDEHLPTIQEYFESIKTGEGWDSNDKMAAIGYLKFLSKFETVFLLKVFASLYGCTDVIFNILQQKNVDITYCADYISEFKEILKKKRNYDGFDEHWKSANNLRDANAEKKRKPSSTPEQQYRQLYYEIIDNLQGNLEIRFSSIEKLQFLELLDASKMQDSARKEKSFENLISTYGKYFDVVRLKNEITAFFDFNKSEHTRMSAVEILTKLHACEFLKNSFEQLYKLCSLVCTIPATTASVERSFSALKRIKTYTRSTQKQGRLSNLSTLSIEKELVYFLKNEEEFYNLVIKNFVTSNRRMELIYK